MHVRVRLFAALRERAGAQELELSLPDGCLVGEALERLGELTAGIPVVMAVNRQYASPDRRLAPGDELALIPPVSGGSSARHQTGGVLAGGADEAADGGGAHGAAPAAAGRAHVRICPQPLSVDSLLALVADARAGAVVCFLGVTREVPALEYEAYAEMAHAQLLEIVRAAIARHGLCAAAAEHRVGAVALSQPSVAVVVSAAHREQAFAGAREIIDEIKARAPIWKREEGEWVRGALPAPADR